MSKKTKRTLFVICAIALAVIIAGGPIYKRLIKGSDEEE